MSEQSLSLCAMVGEVTLGWKWFATIAGDISVIRVNPDDSPRAYESKDAAIADIERVAKALGLPFQIQYEMSTQ